MNRARVAIVGVPFDGNSSYLRGAAEAPPLIRQAFHCDSSNRWTESGMDLGSGVIHDAGDLNFSSEQDVFSEIERASAGILSEDYTPIFFGGDHSITYPILRGFAEKGKRFSILHFDAHPDLYDELDGNRRSHACPFARIMEERLAVRLVQVGIRTSNGHQREQARRFGVEQIEMRDFDEEMLVRFDSPIYISVDLDALDPAFAPGVSHHEPGGLSTRQLLRVIQRTDAPVVGADIVELNPKRDVHGITAMAAAKIFKEIAAKMLT
jgi:agmatinase